MDSIRWVEIEELLKEKNLSDKLKFWKQTIESTKDFSGTSPPSVFVGNFGYPRVFMGILSPPVQQDNADILDSPEQWYQQKATIEQILGYRSEMIYSRFSSDVKNPVGKFVDVTQELAMSKKPTDVEIELSKKPLFRFGIDQHITPVGSPANLLNARLVENPRIERKVDYIVSDVDFKAQGAVAKLYKMKIPVSRIQKMLSAGLLGMKIERKFVPTRWSITAVDDMLGKMILHRVKDYKDLAEIRLFFNEYIGNQYFVLLVPGAYQYELIEMWKVFGENSVSSDYEQYWGRKTYASVTAGAFYAGRLAAMEYLDKIKRQASVLIVRNVTEEYSMPLGIWQLRETVRDAFNKPCEKFDTVAQAVKKISEKVGGRWVAESRLVKNLKDQRKIAQFLKKAY